MTTSKTRPLPPTQAITWGVMLFLALGISLMSARFLLPEPLMAEAMRPHLDARPIIFLTHVVCGMTALSLGALQFVTRQGRRRMWHAAAGRIYVLACLVGAISGLILAWSSIGGPIGTAGFGLLAVAWFTTTGLGLREILAGRIDSHRRWMVRSYALTLAAVSLRLMLPASGMLGLDFMDAYRAIAFLCWTPNLVLAELWLAWRTSETLRPARA
ncbi:DUF2306 domain-containing protein [Brevundimonas sp.]|uniref:DUF2306 domain-containing protein n=1 Tax=Brevundimonas sp. TaxID=1871086 RepID=UPI0025D6A4CF|nr:DUF2306 domain-containing protein [Brevundimonas sp.]